MECRVANIILYGILRNNCNHLLLVYSFEVVVGKFYNPQISYWCIEFICFAHAAIESSYTFLWKNNQGIYYILKSQAQQFSAIRIQFHALFFIVQFIAVAAQFTFIVT